MHASMIQKTTIPTATVFLSLWLMCTEFSPQLQAQEAISTTQDDHVSELIAQLGDMQFALREQASSGLLEVGEAALPQLRQVPANAPFEVRYRAQALRERIEKEKFARLSKSFLLELDPGKSYGLPAWDAYRDLVGASRTSKLLFLEMLRQQPALAQLIELAASEHSSQKTHNDLALRASEEANQIRMDLYSMMEPQIGDVVGMLVTAAVLPSQTPVEVSEVIVSNERRSFGNNIHKQGYEACLRKMLSAWIPKTHAAMAPIVLNISLRYDLPEGVSIARQHLTPNFDTDTRKSAFYCMARFGNETDIATLLPLLNEETVAEEFSRDIRASDIHESNSAPPGLEPQRISENRIVRICDLAMVTVLILSGEDPKTIFPRFEADRQLGFFIHSLASPTDLPEDRTEKIKRWKQAHFPEPIKS